MRLLAALMAVGVCGGCGAKNESDNGTMAPDYVDQTLQGVIGGHAWTFAAGRIEKPRAEETAGRWSVQLVSKPSDKACEGFSLSADDKLSVIFSIKDAPALGRKDLSLGEEGQTITLVDSTGDVPSNYIAVSGFVEITAVEAGTVSAKMAVTAGPNDEVNGKFTMAKCCPKTENSFDYETCKE